MPEIEGTAKAAKKEKKEKKDKKDKKDKKEKKEKDKDKSKEDKGKAKEKKNKTENKEPAPLKRERSKSQDGARVRRSKWGPDIVELPDENTTAAPEVSAEPAEPAPDRFCSVNEESMPAFTEEELLVRTIIMEPIPSDVQAQEVHEFINGAVLAVTGNALLQANRPEAPVFACTLTEVSGGDEITLKVAELTFRTPDGANVGMKLNGLEYQGEQLRIRRPENFSMPEDGVDASSSLDLQSVTMARLIGERNYCSIFNIPEDMTEPIVHDLLSQFGELKFLKMIPDQTTGKLKGYGFFEYADVDDTPFALTALNGFVCGRSVLAIRWMGQPMQFQQSVAPTCSQHPNSITHRIISNKVMASHVKQGLLIGINPSLVVQLLNAVKRSELTDDVEYNDILGQVRNEASKYGKVKQVVIPRPAKDGSHVSGSGVGKIFAVFENLTAARKFQVDSNGRKFDDRTVCAAFYPDENFNEGIYSLPSTEQCEA